MNTVASITNSVQAIPSFGAASYVVGYKLNQFGYQNDAPAEKGVSLGELMQRHGDILWENGKHKDNVRSFIGEINEILCGRSCVTFSQEMLDGLIGTLRNRGNSNATINRKMAALSKLLKKAEKMGEVTKLPTFERQKERQGRIRFLEGEEEDRLFQAIRNQSEDYYNFSVFLVDTGARARLGEATGLHWNDFDGMRATFWLTKSGRSRSVPLTCRAKEAIEAMQKRRNGPFSNIKQYQYRQAWHAAKGVVGLSRDDELVPHTLRHTCASRLVRGGIDIRRVQMWLGHQTLQMTMRYAHLATTDLDACVPVLERHQ